MPTKPATTLASEVRLMQSKHTGRKYRISIALPYAYFEERNPTWPFNKPLKKWPVVYLTGADYYFGMVADMVRSMGWCGRTTDAIVVGIGYPENSVPQEAWRNVEASREHDFSPIRDQKREADLSNFLKQNVETGGANEFLQFIKQELIPVIESEFNADPKRRILAGHSMAGLFTAFALFAEPGLFESYIIGSPWFWYADGTIFKHEEQFAQRRKRLKARVHLWVGELEEAHDDPAVSELFRFESILRSRNYKGLMLIKQVFADESHCEVPAPGFHASLKWLLEK
jgi:predicted alpha/beta superfamily hydrolase